MTTLSAPVGAIVRVWFPESEAVMHAGPKFRPALVLGLTTAENGTRQALVAYGTSQNTNRRGYGDFTVKASDYRSLEKDTRFCLKNAIWLPLDEEFFTANGCQPAPEAISPANMHSFQVAASEAGLI